MGIEERGIWTDTSAIKTAIEAVNTAFQSGGISQAQFAAMVTALQLIDNMISGSEAQVDVVGSLPAGTNVIGRTGHDVTGIGHGVKTVTTPATAEALAGSTACKMVIVQAQSDNTNPVAVGGSGVVATIATGTGVLLYPGEVVTLLADNLADVFVDAITAGEGVRFAYLT